MINKSIHIDKQLAILEYSNRELNFSHTQYDEEAYQYLLLKKGDMEAVNASRAYFKESEKVMFTDDPLINMKYMFVVSATLATRYAIEGGLNSETAYNISDIFIKRMHNCNDLDDIRDVQAEMIEYFTSRIQNIQRVYHYSKPVMMTIEYIQQNLHQSIRMPELSEASFLSPSYLSVLFKKETGMSISDFILDLRLQTARNMLLHSDFSIAEISEILAFSSQSYFSAVFKKHCKQTPAQFRKKNYLKNLNGNVEKTAFHSDIL